MKYLTLAIVFVAATAVSIACRHGLSGTSDAARQEPSPQRLDPAERLQASPEGAFLAVQPASTDDLEFARLAASTGHKLLARAAESPDNPQLLRQAAAHFRACLSHEPTAGSKNPLFAEVREKIASIERDLARPSRPAVAKAAPKAVALTAVPKLVEAVPAPKPVTAIKAELIMVGPDGVQIQRAAPQN